MEEFLKQFKRKFIEETSELLSKLEGDLLELENNVENKECVDEVFRVMHTLKGVAGMYGFINIQDLTHHLETIFEKVGTKEIQLTEDILNITFSSVDHIKALLDEDDAQKQCNSERHEEIIQQVNDILEIKVEPVTRYDSSIVSEKTENDFGGVSSFYITLQVEESFSIRGIDLNEIFQELADIGEHKVIQDSPPSQGEIKNQSDKEDEVLGIFFATSESYEDIEDVFLFVSDCIEITKIASINIFEQEDFVKLLDNFETHSSPENLEKKDYILNFVEDRYANIKPTSLEAKVKFETVKPYEVKVESSAAVLPKAVETPCKSVPLTSHRISVDAEKLDTLMYLVTELVTTQSQLELAIQLKDFESLEGIHQHIKKLTNEFRDNTVSMRLVPVSDLLISFKRLIRDLSKSLGKEVELITQGMETELDKSTIEAVRQPLMHILRNSIDHGIEMPEEREKKGKARVGVVKLTAHHSGNFVFINIQDDGAGIDHDYIKRKAVEKGIIDKNSKLTEKEVQEIIFLSGFSTAHQLTEVSGRGMGMDIVQQKIDELRGEIEINSELGLGTSFTIKLQQTIAIVDTMLIQVKDISLMIPLSEVEVCIQRLKKEMYNGHSRKVEYEESLIPVVDLRNEFGISDLKLDSEEEQLVIINKKDQKFAITADKIIGEYQAVLKPLGEMFTSMDKFSGASVLGDGSIAFMLDTSKFIFV